LKNRYLILIGSRGIWELHRNPQGPRRLWWTKKEAEREIQKIETKNPHQYDFISLEEATIGYHYGAVKGKKREVTLKITIKGKTVAVPRNELERILDTVALAEGAERGFKRSEAVKLLGKAHTKIDELLGN